MCVIVLGSGVNKLVSVLMFFMVLNGLFVSMVSFSLTSMFTSGGR